MFEQPQELVGGGQVGGVVAADVPAVTEGRQRIHGRCHMQRLVVSAVHQLQQLHGELDVAQPAGAQLDLARAHTGRNQFLDAPTHRLHFRNEVLPLACRPDHRHQRVDVLLPQLGVPGGGPCLHQRLELPRLGPALVVGDVRVKRAHQLAVLAFGPQRRVDFEERVGGEPHHLAGHPGGDRVGILRDEDDVDVADVVQFAGAALAHRDHRQPRHRGGVALGPNGHRQRGIQCGVGQVGQMRTDARERHDGFVLDRGRQVQAREYE